MNGAFTPKNKKTEKKAKNHLACSAIVVSSIEKQPSCEKKEETKIVFFFSFQLFFLAVFFLALLFSDF